MVYENTTCDSLIFSRSQEEVRKHYISHHPFFHMLFIIILATDVITRKNGNDDELLIVAKSQIMEVHKNGASIQKC